jgi:hypothetical protein
MFGVFKKSLVRFQPVFAWTEFFKKNTETVFSKSIV